jgi:hypothetical protein
MRRLISRRPSPAMAVAFVALLAALTGTAVALPGTNTVNSGDIVNNTIRSKDVRNNNLRGKDVRNGSLSGRDVRNGSLTGADVRNDSLTGADVRNDSLTGADVNESTLAKVPNAAHADTADTATTANSAGSVTGLLNFPLTRAPAAASLAAAPQVPLGSRGNFRFYGKCYVSGVDVFADIYVALTSGVAYFGTEDEGDGLLLPTTPEADRKVEGTSGGAPPNGFNVEDNDADFRATDGITTITGVVGLAFAKQGSVPNPGPFGAGNACLFGGSVFG